METVYVVTGAAGHLGSTIVRALAARGSAVRALVRPGEDVPGSVASAAEVVEGDITDRASLEPLFAGLDGRDVVVLHTAGIVSIGSATRAELLRVNVGGTANVARACLAHGVRRLVYVSSVHAIPAPAGRGAADPIVETKDFDPARVSGDYAKSKAIATRHVLGLVGRGLEIVVVHPSGFLGPFDRGANHLVQLIGLHGSGRLPATVRGGFDFADVRDVADGCVRAADLGRPGETYILSGTFATITELLATLGGKVPVAIPRALAAMAAPFAEAWGRVRGTRPLFTRYAIETLGAPARFSHEKAARELGYQVRGLAETVRDTLGYLAEAARSAAPGTAPVMPRGGRTGARRVRPRSGIRSGTTPG